MTREQILKQVASRGGAWSEAVEALGLKCVWGLRDWCDRRDDPDIKRIASTLSINGMSRRGPKRFTHADRLARLKIVQASASRSEAAKTLGIKVTALNTFLSRHAPYGVDEAIAFFEAETEGANT